MKRCLAVLFAALMLFALCACGKDNDESGAETYTEQEDALSATFANAELLYSWFTGCNHISTDDSDIRMLGEDTYVKVNQTGYTSCEELQTALSRYFTPEIVSELMNTTVYNNLKLFQDIDGALYTYDNYVGLVRWDIGERVGHITEQDDSNITYHLDVSYTYYKMTYTMQFDYKYVLCEDGQWRFSDFALPAEIIGEEMFGMNEIEG